MKLSKNTIAKTIDHTFLKPDGSLNDIKQLCNEASDNNFASVAISPYFVKYASERLSGTEVGIDVAIGFPLGYTTTLTKVFETKESIKNGATEVDVVVNISAVKDGKWDKVKEDIQAVTRVTGDIILKVIFETCYLSKSEIRKLAQLCLDIEGIDYIKTSTGFGPKGATVENVKLMKEVVGHELKIKAAGGIKTLEDYIKLRKVGADRIGTSSGLSILSELDNKNC